MCVLEGLRMPARGEGSAEAIPPSWEVGDPDLVGMADACHELGRVDPLRLSVSAKS